MKMSEFKKMAQSHLEQIVKNHPELEPFTDKYPNFTGWEEYIWQVVYFVTRIEDTLGQLKHILIYLARFPESPRYRKYKITRTRYAIYHLENFVIRFYSLFDKSLILVNYVCALDVNPRYCTLKKVKKKLMQKFPRSKNIVEKLELNLANIYEIVQPFEELRHLNVHRGVFEISNSFLRLHFINEQFSNNPELFSKNDRVSMHTVTQKRINLLIDKHSCDIEKIEEAIENLFISFIKPCRLTVERLKLVNEDENAK